MKKITTILILLLVITIVTKSQNSLRTDERSKSNFTATLTAHSSTFHLYDSMELNTIPKKEYYRNKSREQKTTAWVLLGGGTGCIALGFIIGNRKESTFGEAATGVLIGGIGLLSTIGSIPLFIAARKNKIKASLSFDIQPPAPLVFLINKNIHSISLKIPLNR